MHCLSSISLVDSQRCWIFFWFLGGRFTRRLTRCCDTATGWFSFRFIDRNVIRRNTFPNFNFLYFFWFSLIYCTWSKSFKICVEVIIHWAIITNCIVLHMRKSYVVGSSGTIPHFLKPLTSLSLILIEFYLQYIALICIPYSSTYFTILLTKNHLKLCFSLEIA